MLTSAASTATVSTINNKGNVGAALKDTFSADSLKNYLVAGATAGLTAGFYNEWTNTSTAPAPALTEATNGAMANSGAVTVANSAGGLSSWQGVGQFAANQALQNTTSAVLNRVLGREGRLGDALKTSLVNAFTAYGFNLVGDVSKDVFADGSAPKIALHALMGGLAAEAAGGDFKTGAISAGVNEAVVSRLSDFYGQMKKEDKDRLLLMNSQLIGVLATVAQDPYADTEKLQLGSWVAQNSTQYNWLLHQEIEEADKARAACDSTGGAVQTCKDNITRATDQLSKLRDQQMYEYGRALQEKAYQEVWTRQEYEAGLQAYWGNIDKRQVVVSDPAAAQAGFISRELYAGAKDAASTLPSRTWETVSHPLDLLSGAFDRLISVPGAFSDWISSPIPAQSIERSLDNLATLSAANTGGLLFDSATGLLVAGVGGKLVSWVGGKWVELKPTSTPTPAGELSGGQVNVSPVVGVNGAKGTASTLETTSPVAISGRRAIDKAQSYESGIRGMYGGTNAFDERQFRAVVDGKVVKGVADDVAIIGGKKTAVEAKFVEDWSGSLRNPASPSGSKPWSVAEQNKMVAQAKKYSSGFDGGVVYHTNSPELASHYSKLFTEAGLTKFKFVITPAKN